MKLAAALVALVGAALIAAGLVLGFGTVRTGNINCGSALHGTTTDAADVQMYTDAMEGTPVGLIPDYSGNCQSAVSSRKTATWAVLAPGIVLVGAALVLLIADGAREQGSREQPLDPPASGAPEPAGPFG